MRFPPDLDTEFSATWEAFLELKAVQDVATLSPLAVEDAFRLLLQQAGIKLKPLFTAKRFITVNTVVKQLKRRLDLSHVLNHMNVRRHDFTVTMPTAKQINVIHRPRFIGTVELKPRGFTLDYLLNRMLELKVFKHQLPAQLNDKDRPTRYNIRERDWHDLYRDREWSLSICRIRNGTLLLRYDVTIDAVLPSYVDAEKQLKNIWQTAMTGVI